MQQEWEVLLIIALTKTHFLVNFKIMKNITAVSLWDKGTMKEGAVLNTYAINVQLDKSATFWWGLFSTVDGNIGELLSQGNLTMPIEVYNEWETDDYAWDWVAAQLNLNITGDYVQPVVEAPIVEEPIDEVQP
jgi:hypothetical protein